MRGSQEYRDTVGKTLVERHDEAGVFQSLSHDGIDNGPVPALAPGNQDLPCPLGGLDGSDESVDLGFQVSAFGCELPGRR